MKSVELKFVVYTNDVPSNCDWLDLHFYAYSFCRVDSSKSILKIDAGGLIGIAGRCFDIGYAVAYIEKRSQG